MKILNFFVLSLCMSVSAFAITLRPGESMPFGNTVIQCEAQTTIPTTTQRCCRLLSINAGQTYTLWIDGSNVARLSSTFSEAGRLKNWEKLKKQAIDSGCQNVEQGEDTNSIYDGRCQNR